jgi:hypothetical protein
METRERGARGCDGGPAKRDRRYKFNGDVKINGNRNVNYARLKRKKQAAATKSAATGRRGLLRGKLGRSKQRPYPGSRDEAVRLFRWRSRRYKFKSNGERAGGTPALRRRRQTRRRRRIIGGGWLAIGRGSRLRGWRGSGCLCGLACRRGRGVGRRNLLLRRRVCRRIR